jgi:uncharacterized repeat protein (TIGR03803 family)
VQGGNGAFYGTTYAGGSNGDGTVFEISTNGALTPLYSFTNGIDGARPYAGLVLGSDGNFYGTATAGGANQCGTVFKMTAAGALTPLYSFTNGIDGAEPVGALAQAGDGVLYGTTAGSAGGNGSVFKISTNGAFTALYSFTNGIDGAQPYAGLVLGSDGNFYGTTTSGGGPNGDGGIFRITLQGALTALYVFTGGADGASPCAVLTPGSEGDLYGTTQYGGADGDGAVFKLNLYATAPQLVSITRSAGVIGLTWTGLPGQSYQAQYATTLNQTTWSDLGGPVIATYGIGSQSDPSPTNTQRFYRVYQLP